MTRDRSRSASRSFARSHGLTPRSWRAAALSALLVASLLPSMPASVPDVVGGSADVCACGCGNPEGRCCCTAPSSSGLASVCSERNEPIASSGSAEIGKVLGPRKVAEPSPPLPAPADLAEPEQRFTGPGPCPETPPPRG